MKAPSGYSHDDHPLLRKYRQAADEYEHAVRDLTRLPSWASKEEYDGAVNRVKATRRATQAVREALAQFD